MANSGQMTTTNQYIVYRIECTQNWQSIEGNYSNVTVKVWVWRTNTGYTTYGSGTCYCKIDGTTYSNAITSSQKITNSGIYLFQHTVNVGHNSDGSKSLGMSAWISHSQFSSSEQWYTQGLSTIPRTSSASLSTTTPQIGSNMTININRASSSFTHTIYDDFYVGSWSQIASGVGTSFIWTVPSSHMNRIPNATSGGGRIRVVTYSGGTYIGEVILNYTANVPDSVVPTVTSLNTYPVGVDVGGYVQGKHQVRVTMAGNWNGGANYGSVTINVDGSNYNGTDITSGIVYSSGNKSVSTTMRDTRGRTATRSTTIHFWGYWNPTCGISAFRCDSAGNRDDVNGTYLKITVSGNSCNVGEVNRNTSTCLVQYRISGGDWIDYYTVGSTISGSNYLFNDTRITSNWNIEKGYEIRVRVSDKWTSSFANATINTGFTTMDFRNGGKGVAIGKVAESDSFEVGMEMKMYNNITFPTDKQIGWIRNTDEAVIGFKNDGDGDTDSYMYFQTGDNGNEYFVWRHRHSSNGYINYMSLNSGGLWVRGNVNPANNNYHDLGNSSFRWGTLWSVNAVNTSDAEFKENIEYISNNDVMVLPFLDSDIKESADTETITRSDIYDFIKNNYKLAKYNYLNQEHDEFGFIAQDIVGSKVGRKILLGEDGEYAYSIGTQLGIIVGALQEEIKLRDIQLEKQNEINQELEDKTLAVRDKLLVLEDTLAKNEELKKGRQKKRKSNSKF